MFRLTECDNAARTAARELLESFFRGGKSAELVIALGETAEPHGYEAVYDPDAGRVTVRCDELRTLGRALLMADALLKEPNAGDGTGALRRVSGACPFPDFGIMLDCSRNAVPRVSAVKQMLRIAALLGYSYVGLYTEDTLRVQDEPYFGYMRGAFSREEIRECDACAASLGLELRPYIQTLAHINQIVRYQDYFPAVDTGDILKAGAERTERLLRHLIRQVSEDYSTRRVNIGMDEAELVGLGSYLQEHGYRGQMEVMQEHLDMVLGLCREYGLIPQMWSDMFLKIVSGGAYDVSDPARLEAVRIPEGISLCYWDYYSKDYENYDRKLRLHQKLTDRIAFAGGAWKWSGFAPHNQFSIRCGAAAIRACRDNRIPDVVLTCWGDDGAEADMFSVLPVLFADAAAAYGDGLPEEAFRTLSGGYSMEEFLALDDVNIRSRSEESCSNSSKYLLYQDPLQGAFDSVVDQAAAQEFGQTAARLEALAVQKEGPYAFLFETAGALCRVLEKKADLGIRLRDAYLAGDRKALAALSRCELPELLVRLDRFYDLFRAQWHRDNRSFGFEVQTIRIGGLRQRLADIIRLVESYLDGTLTSIEELEEPQLPYGYSGKDKPLGKLGYNRWTDMTSASRLTFGGV
ncbi:beta-N-acetylhexosaminidase [Lachnoclostridium sp. Marseille-P6806]|uniref:beta-N-acetylhexosaminidase n=1 Tax=Lachnoclostridium sp. Marseille-P6806 TaxID=2364793 RepID=UPI00103099EE|nr:beta-N-acetylhexosaminidase [Lachnoclostridium sp. Marseille-P6806]